jgi:hypothetical protein
LAQPQHLLVHLLLHPSLEVDLGVKLRHLFPEHPEDPFVSLGLLLQPALIELLQLAQPGVDHLLDIAVFKDTLCGLFLELNVLDAQQFYLCVQLLGLRLFLFHLAMKLSLIFSELLDNVVVLALKLINIFLQSSQLSHLLWTGSPHFL